METHIIPVQQVVHVQVIFEKHTWAEAEKQWLREGCGQILKGQWPEIMAALLNMNRSASMSIEFATSAKDCNKIYTERLDRLNSNVVIQVKSLKLSPSPDPNTGFDCGVWLFIHLSGRRSGDPGTIVLIEGDHRLLPAR